MIQTKPIVIPLFSPKKKRIISEATQILEKLLI